MIMNRNLITSMVAFTALLFIVLNVITISWNLIIPKVFGFPKITMLQTIGICFLIALFRLDWQKIFSGILNSESKDERLH